MTQNRYVLVFGETEENQFHSLTFTRAKLIFILITFVGCFLTLTYFIAGGIFHLETEYRLLELRRENAHIRQNFSSWKERFSKLNTAITDLQKKNQQIWTTTFLSPPEIEYGVGGRETIIRSGFVDLPQLNQLELKLSKLETNISLLHQNTIELEHIISSKIKEIAHYPSISPLRGGWLSSTFGKRIDPFTGKAEDHPGIDISIKPGSEICATGAGVIKEVNNRVIKNKGYGKYVIIDHGFGYETLYAHLSTIFVKKGQRIKRWDLIGMTGNTGKSTAPHLHYGVYVKGKLKNPFDFILE